MADQPTLLCPSAQPEMADAKAFGLVDHALDKPTVGYLEATVDVTPELLELAAPLRPTEVFRFAAPCQGDACSHWSGSSCKLVDRIVELIPPATLVMPPCQVRASCRWFAQAGRAACMRCPHVVTQDEHPTDDMRLAATPE